MPQQEQRLIEQEPADADDDDRGIDIGEGETRAPDGDVIAEPDGIADHLGDDDDDDRYRQRDPQPGKMLGSVAGRMTRDRTVARLAPQSCAVQTSRVCTERKPK